ncbi:MAG: hypothetical protein KIS76_16195 [Pyrinomonadaceae bacterium]|nr:hypothetical protein [Pyrinomonadaceae bacterium]
MKIRIEALTLSVGILIVLLTGQISAQIIRNSEVFHDPISFWRGVYPLGQFGWGGCGSLLRKTLIIRDTRIENFFVSFNGGKRLGGVFATNQCSGLAGYTSRKFYRNGNSPGEQTEHSELVMIEFSRAVTLESLRIQTKVPAVYEIRINDSISRLYQATERSEWEPQYPYRMISMTSDLGFDPKEVLAVRKVSIRAIDSSDWAFAVDNVRFTDIYGGGGGGPTPAPPNTNEPVILIPGVAASELREVGTGVRWLSPRILLANVDINALKLPSNRNIIATDIFHNQIYFDNRFPADFYREILRFLTDPTNPDSIGRLYEVAGIPERRTEIGCDRSQNSDDPNLKPRVFVFAYDWRKSNAQTAQSLREYVECIRVFHPGGRVNIVAHSMGGLVARRYVLDNPSNHGIGKLITIGSPFLGAPKAIHALETGNFIAPAFEATITEQGANFAVASYLKAALKTFPGPIQLLPSERYFDLNESHRSLVGFRSPLSVRKYSWSNEEQYSYAQTNSWLNRRHETFPGITSQAFHSFDYQGLQDDWRTDTSDVNYFHIYGLQNANLTVGQIKVVERTFCGPALPPYRCFVKNSFEPVPTEGDGTVPLLSSRRISLSHNLNNVYAKRYIANARTQTGQTNSKVEHNGLVSNHQVHSTLAQILKGKSSNSGLPEDNDQPVTLTSSFKNDEMISGETPAFYVKLNNVGAFSSVPFDSQPTIIGGSGENGMQALPMNDQSAWLAMPADKSYKVSFKSETEPVRIDVMKGLDYDRIEKSVVYLDLDLPANSQCEMIIAPFDNPRLYVDTDNDGFPDTYIEPTLVVDGAQANDIESPLLSFDYSNGAYGKVVSLYGIDKGSGLRAIFYSLNGQDFSPYVAPIHVGSAQEVIYAFAEDNNLNRSGISPIELVGRTYSIGNRVWFDINNDGKINNDALLQERGAESVSVSLFVDSNADGVPDDISQPLATTRSDGEGYYRFDSLSTGTYVVRIDPSNFEDGSVLSGYRNSTAQVSAEVDSDSTRAGEDGIISVGGNRSMRTVGIYSGTIELGPDFSEPTGELDTSADDRNEFDGFANLTVDFGFYRLGLSGTVWNDSGNGSNSDNGIQDEDEQGISNFTVRIFDGGGNQIPVGLDGILGTSDDELTGVLTDENGNYSFQGLNAGTYIVKLERQFVAASSVASDTPDDNIDYDNNGAVGEGVDSQFVLTRPITLSPGARGILENTYLDEYSGITNNVTIDVGLRLSPTVASISLRGAVLTSEGLPIARAQITVFDLGSNEIKTAETNPLGYFSFDTIAAGSSVIIFTRHKEYRFDPVLFQTSEDINDFVLMAKPF